MKFLGGEKVIPSASNAEDDIEVGGGVKHRGDYEYALQKVEEAFVPAAEIEGSRKANVSGTEVYIVGQFENSTSAAEDDIENASLVGQSGFKIWGICPVTGVF